MADELAATLERAPAGPPDVTVHLNARPSWADDPLDPNRTLHVAARGDTGDSLTDAGVVIGGAGTRLRFAEGATVWIGASLATVWLEYGRPLTAADAAYFLLEPAMGFVLRARGVLAMHASAVVIDGRAVLFCGTAGSGKSTTAAACVAAGHTLLSDDVVALDRSDSTWTAHRGTTLIRLWDDGARALGHDAETLPRFSPTWTKRTLDPGRRVAVAGATVGLLCVFGPREAGTAAPHIERVSGAMAFKELVAHTAANRLHDAARRAGELVQLARLATDVPVVRIRAPENARRLPELVAAIAAAVHG